MEIVLATNGLVRPGGTETYCVTVASALERLGHAVTLHAVHQGPFADRLRANGTLVAADAGELPASCDAVVANSADSAYELAARYPGVPIVYVCHSQIFELQTPPQIPGVCSALVTLYGNMEVWARALEHLPEEVLRLYQPVDLRRFDEHGAPRERPRRLLMLGNYLRGPRRAMVESVCEELGIEAVLVGEAAERSDRPELAIWDADIVVGQGRAIAETLACGRAAYVFDVAGGDGWVTPESYERLEAANFSGMATEDVIDRERLVADLRAYRADMGPANRHLAVGHHSSGAHAVALVDLIRRAPAAAPVVGDAALRDMARLVRRQWDTEGRALGAEHEAERLHALMAAQDDRLTEEREARAASDARVHELESALRVEEHKVLGLEARVRDLERGPLRRAARRLRG